MKVIVDPADDILYKSFYIYGLEKLYGADNVKISSTPFSGLSWSTRNTKSLRFVVQSGVKESKYVISCDDSYKIIPELYDWCDAYGSVNANFTKTEPKYHQKLVSLCPSFAIRCWDMVSAVRKCVETYPHRVGSPRKHLGKYKRLLQRNPYQAYCPNDDLVKNDYIFHLSTKWISDEWNRNDECVNMTRANFIRACKKQPNLCFEGGLLLSPSDPNQAPFADCRASHMTSGEWLRHTKESAIVFNTPAYWQCHGWKLGEYMALGKAILSTPLSNDLPVPLTQVCKNGGIHFVENNYECIADGVRFMINHKDYCNSLSKEIYEYWEKYGTPTASLRLLGID